MSDGDALRCARGREGAVVVFCIVNDGAVEGLEEGRVRVGGVVGVELRVGLGLQQAEVGAADGEGGGGRRQAEAERNEHDDPG